MYFLSITNNHKIKKGMDLMTLAKGQEFDIYRMVSQRVGFKRSYNDVVVALNQKFVREAFARPGWWATVIMTTDTCISICNDMRLGNMERSRNVSYLYLQNFKGRWVDNVRSSYLVRTIKDMNVPHNYHLNDVWSNPECKSYKR